ncbi:S1 family peptidase [Actinomadura sp. WMMB 499]|uniref:S1 family peptidase n=1 Tax=Actinomadura sp. WMMB 499 TaxID=1219491 RepID=UPI0012483AB3|nr:S1 family peptidase [Actinomadura sp. WMMB 499]QFG25183.1 S1 family peptidase [Actinomadura sp. WMMB 499]
MARKRTVLGIMAASGLLAASVTPASAQAASTASHRTQPAQAQPAQNQAAPAAPAPDPDLKAARIQKKLEMSLGADFGGAWVERGSGRSAEVVVATTDAGEAAEIAKEGATPKVVKYDARDLASVQTGLNRHAKSAPAAVTAWYVSPVSNRVVVEASSRAAVQRFARASGVDAGAVEYVHSAAKPRPLYDIIGGERYWTPSSGCSVAFSVDGGYITAGHCGGTGTTTSGDNQAAQGRFGGSSFPGNDYAWVDTNSQWTPTPRVNRWNGTYQTVNGAVEAPVGTRVCRSGSTTNTQIWCGQILQRGATVRYAEGTVTGLIRTNICADPGDSGGALFTEAGQAQGITSGGSGTCRDGQGGGDSTYFQPVGEVLQILAQQGRELVTGDGGPGPDPGSCDGHQTTVSGSLSSGANAYQPNGSYYQSTSSGAHTACLDGPTGTDFDLYLQKWSGSSWQTVAQSISPTPDENISYNGTAGYYRYRVHAYSGSGAYTLGFSRP